METQKKRRGDRKDGRLMRELDSLHYVTGILYPNRCDNEAYISQRIDLTNMNAYIAKKNETETEFPYTMFHLVLAALMKTITLRPKLNRFIVNSNFYQRNEVSASFGRRGAGLPALQGRVHALRHPRLHPPSGDGVPVGQGRPLHRSHGYPQQDPSLRQQGRHPLPHVAG